MGVTTVQEAGEGVSTGCRAPLVGLLGSTGGFILGVAFSFVPVDAERGVGGFLVPTMTLSLDKLIFLAIGCDGPEGIAPRRSTPFASRLPAGRRPAAVPSSDSVMMISLFVEYMIGDTRLQFLVTELAPECEVAGAAMTMPGILAPSSSMA